MSFGIHSQLSEQPAATFNKSRVPVGSRRVSACSVNAGVLFVCVRVVRACVCVRALARLCFKGLTLYLDLYRK